MEFTIEEDAQIKKLISTEYNYVYNKVWDVVLRWGRTKDENPLYSPYGPEMAYVDMSEMTAELLAVMLPFLNSTGTMFRIIGLNTPKDKESMIAEMSHDAKLYFCPADYAVEEDYSLFSLYIDKTGNVCPARRALPYGNVCSLDNLAVVWNSDAFRLYIYKKLVEDTQWE